MLIVTGASGKLGGLVVEALLRTVPAAQIGISVRDPQKLTTLAARGVRVRQGDYADADSLRHAWDGVRHVLVVSSNARTYGEDPLQHHETAIKVAKELGAERIFYTSQTASSAQSQFPPARDHAATEEMLAASGLAWTALRHGFYAESAMGMNAHGFGCGRLVGPADGKVAWATHEDLAEVDARLLAGQEIFEGATPPLTGSEALDLADLAQMVSTLTEKKVTRETISEEKMLKNLENAGVPAPVRSVIQGYYRAAKAGEFAAVDPTLARILGRAPSLMRDVLTRALA